MRITTIDDKARELTSFGVWINFGGNLNAVQQSQNKPQERYRICIEWFECSKINSALCNCTGRSWKQRRMFSHGETNWASPWIHFKEILTVYSFWICHNIELEIYSAQLVSSLFPLEMFKANPRSQNSFRYWGFLNFLSSFIWLLGQASFMEAFR